MAFVAGLIAHSGKKDSGEPSKLRSAIGAVCGALLYVALYVAQQYVEFYIIIGNELNSVLILMGQKGVVSLINGAIAVTVSLLLNALLRPALKKAGLLDKLDRR